MPLECSLLQRKSSLTDTKNRILLETERTCGRKNLTQAFVRKRPLEPSFSLRSDHLTVNTLLSRPEVENKFLKTENFPDSELLDIQYEGQCLSAEEKTFMRKKKKKKLAKILEDIESVNELMDCQYNAVDSLSCPVGFDENDTESYRSLESDVCGAAPPSPLDMPQLLKKRVLAFKFPAMPARSAANFCFGSAMGMPQAESIPVLSILNKMPAYHFESLPSKWSTEFDYKSVEDDSGLLLAKVLREKKIIKMHLLNAVSISLLRSPNFSDADDPFRAYLIKCATNVVSFDPEFILKVALYTRQELNIRSTANFLLAFAANENSCRTFLKKYFESSIVLPTDWISVAEMYLVFNPDVKPRSLPAALRKVMKSTFTKFDAYQLAKYNRPKKSGKKTDKQEGSSSTEMQETTKKSYSLKELIRLLHIASPVEHVLAILGKKYPSDPESFRQLGLPGTWNSENAGKRMKLPTPETWETMISTKGNKPEVWESLIDKSKLPYMATLRNLRNLILSGISSQHHKKVQAHLSKKGSVIKSRQFPLRFFAAFKVLKEIENLLDKEHFGELIPKNLSKIPVWRIIHKKALQKKVEKVEECLIEEYKESLSAAIEISVNHNLDPIGGRTLIICDLTDNLSDTSGAAHDFCDKKIESCILLLLMCLKACEECEAKAILSDGSVIPVELTSKLFLENVTELSSKCESASVSDVDLESVSDDLESKTDPVCRQLPGILENYLKGHTLLHQKLDNVIFLKSSCIGDKSDMSSFLHKYRQLVNPDLLYIEVDLSVDMTWPCEFPATFEEDQNNVSLVGFSEHIFKFIAKRSNGGQLAYVENIDKKYNLIQKLNVTCPEDSLMSSLPTFGQKIEIFSAVPKWKTVRIFVSSTFKDMHGERDLLLRYVFPELKARAASLVVKINEIDLRWGISEDAMSSRSHQLCLLEAQNSDFFIGILGERYGTRCRFDGDVDPRLSWVEEHKDSSITELEMQAFTLHQKSYREKAFFFIRNNMFIRQVPNQCLKYFEVEDSDSEKKLQALKGKVRTSGMAVFDKYPCHFAGVYEEKPVVAGLDMFGQSVLNNLWNAISKFYKKDDDTSEKPEEDTYHHEMLSSSSCFVGEQNSPLSWVMKELKSTSGIFVVTGKPGCGKTAFIIRVLQELKSGVVIPYFIGLSSQSADLSYMLCHIGNSILSKLPLDISVPNTKESLLNNFPDIITEGSKASFPGTLFLVIDGLDYLDTEAQTLDWLPYDLPQGLRLICSASESSEAYRSLQKREKNGCPVFFVPMKPLVVADRQQLVRHYLQQHGKSLDESPFNNQMLQLVTKADSGNPLYLEVACDYLKTFAVFENLMQKLVTFPSALNQVLEEIIIQMEKLHGSTMVQNALTLMCIVKEGLEDSEMHILLSVSETEQSKGSSAIMLDQLINLISSLKPECMIPPVKFCSLVHMLKTFAYPYGKLSHASLRLASKEFASVVMKYYSKSNYVKMLPYFHILLAAYYFTLCNPKRRESWKGASNTAFCSLLYHLLHGKCLAKLATFLCCIDFIQGAFEANAGEDLPEYYETLLNGDNIKSVPISKDKIQDYGNFVGQNMHVLKSWPFLIYQQALNEPVDSCVYKEHRANKGLTLECVTRSSETLSCHPKTLDGFGKSIVCVKSHQLEPIAILGSEDGSAKVLHLYTGKILSSLRGHALSITSMCFVGKDRICLSSSDNTLSIWSIFEHYRIAVLEGHTRFVSSCCCDPQGNIVSSGWDCTVRFWSSQDGRPISCINDIRCPVNSVAHHPEQQLIACGLWNKTIEIWNTVSLSKRNILRGHSGSVQSVVYSADGLHLLSSSLYLEVFIWSTNECLQVGKLDGHTSFVNSICCSSSRSCVVTASDDTTLKVWPDEQQPVQMTIQEFKTHPILFMEIVSPLLLAVAFQNSTVRVFDLVDGHVVSELDTTSDPVSCFSKFTSGKIVEQNDCIDRSVEVLLYGTKSGKAMELKFGNASATEVTCLNSYMTVMRHSECVIFCGTTNGDVAVLSLKDNVGHGIVYAAHQNTVTALSAVSSGMYGCLLSVSADKTVKLWEFGDPQNTEDITPRLKITYQSKHKDRMTSCCLHQKSLSSAKSVMVTGSYDNTVVIWNDSNEQVLTGLKTSVSGVYYSGKYIVACGSEGTIAIWTQKGKCVSNIPGIQKSSAVIAFDFQKDKTSINDFDATLAFVENDGSISIRKPFQRSSLCTLKGHGNKVTSCDINRNDVILSCSSDKTVNIWKLPPGIASLNGKTYHSGRIKTVALSNSGNLAFSGDEYGNLILWQIRDQEEKHCMKYITQKKYTDGIITAVCWMKNEEIICAVQMREKGEEKHFIEIIICKSCAESGCSPYTIQVQRQRCFSSEITTVDYLVETNAVAVGLKSGEIFLMNSNVETKLKVANDWIVKIKLSAAPKPVLFVAETDGIMKEFPFSSLIKSKIQPKEISLFENEKPWITALSCDPNGTVYVGDTSGRIVAYNPKFTVTKQAHLASVSDICTTGGYLFTCSLDRTVKVWNPSNLKQIGQFHSQSPISCLAAPAGMLDATTSNSLILLFGTVVGDVHVLRLTNAVFPMFISSSKPIDLRTTNNNTVFRNVNIPLFGVNKTVGSDTVFGGISIPSVSSQSDTVFGKTNIPSVSSQSDTVFGNTNIPSVSSQSDTIFGNTNIPSVSSQSGGNTVFGNTSIPSVSSQSGGNTVFGNTNIPSVSSQSGGNTVFGNTNILSFSNTEFDNRQK